MPEIARFYGIIIKLFFGDHPPPHFHAEHQGDKAVFDFRGNILRGDISSRTAVRLIREWVDQHQEELAYNWTEMEAGRGFKPIEPLK